ncbi:YDG domain-containing protein [Janthinobacterium sp.]|uniref:beta strand repeat-containing protein n=1 Tax=Janthinobacterium sp. TaxID=1871054 RepID=UPI00289979BA|nr:YDG domain-containing protein [Janthinobacterium sp.]
MTAQAAGNLLKTVVNNTGIIEAHTIDTRGGSIKLLGDMQTGTVNAAGTLDASAPASGNGGFVETSAAHVNVADGIKVSAKATNGLSGTWLIDPVDFNIAASGGNISGTTLTNSLKAADVQIWSTKGSGGTAGNINVNDVVSWSANKLTLTAQNNINVNAAMRGTGTASLALEYGQQAVAAGNASVYNVKAAIDLPSGNSFSTKLGSDGALTKYTVINSLGDMASTSGLDLQGMRGNLARNYALGANIDASSSASWNSNQGFMPVGDGTTLFTGKFDGLGHDISGLTMVRSSQLGGLFGEVGTAGVVRNVNLVGASFNMQDVTYSGFGAGMLAGRNRGLIDNASASGTMTSRYGILGGGLVGQNFGTINNSTSSGAYKVIAGSGYGGGGLVYRNQLDAVVQNSSSSMTISGIDGTTGAATTATGLGGMGGLVRNNLGRIANSFATGAISGNASVGGLVGDTGIKSTITGSFATGAVLGSGSVGGLVGNNTGAISNSYATGNVGINNSTGSIVGGLVGTNRLTSGSISNSYATGNVSGYRTTGGVTGSNSATINNVYSTGTVTVGDTAYNRSGGVVGDNSAGTLTNGYYNTTANAVLPGVGFAQGTGTMLTGTTGLSAAAMLIPASFTSFSFTSSTGAAGNNWVAIGADGTVNGSGGTRPMLSAEYSDIINSVHQLQLMALNVAGTYRIGNSFSAAATAGGDVWGTGGFIPVGTSALPFIGSLNGAGRIISGLSIAKSGVSNVGLFGVIGAVGTVANVGLSGGAVTGSLNVGALAGTNQGTVSGSFATSAVVGDSSGGGLVGNNIGAIKDSYASGSVGGNNTMGGLVGTNTGTIASSYANGAVSTGSVGGGLVATGKGSVTGSYWDMTTSSQPTSAGGTGMTSSDLKTLANYNSATSANGSLNPAWELSNMWAVYDGQSAPLLRSFMKPLVITVSKDTKVYDGLAASAGSNSVTYSNVVDNSSLLGTPVYAGSSGGAVNAGTYAVSASGQYSTTQLGYAVTYIDGGLVITPRQLSLTGVSAGSKVYDGTTSAALTGGSISGVLAADQGNVTFNAASMIGAYASKNVGNNLAVSASGGLSGSASANYALGPLTGVTGNITPKALTISGLAAITRQYDGTTVTTLTGGTLDGLIAGEVVTAGASTGIFADINAGAGKALTVIPGSLVDGTGLASNYTLTAPTGITGTITPKALTVIGAMAADRVYDGSTLAVISGGSLDGLVGKETLTLTSMTGVFADKNVGTAKAVTVSGAALTGGANGGVASNYTVTDPTGLTANVTKATISTVSNIVADSKVYDANTKATVSATGATFNGMVGGDSLSLSATNASFADKNAGVAKNVAVTGIALGGTDAGNYNLASSTGSGSGTITPKAVTITGMTAVNKVYDGSTKASVSGGAISGTVGAETLGATGLVATFDDKNAGVGKTVTTTGTTLVNGNNGGLASNYTVTNPTFTANITPKALTVSGMTAGSKVYDGLLAAALSGGTLSGLVSGETLVLTGGTGVFGDKNVGSGKQVTVSGVAIADGSGLASNYTVTNPTSVTGSITQKALTVSGPLAASDKVYDGTTAASVTGGALSGFVGTETVELTGLTGTFADQNAGSGKAVTVSGGTLVNGSNGGLAGNYSVNASGSTKASITQKALTVTGATAASRVYDGSTLAVISGGSLDGLVGKETLTLTSMTGVFADKNVGTAKAVTVSGAALTGGANGGVASNYTVTDPTGLTANVTKATISTVSNIVADSKVYDANTKATVSATGATFNGMVGGDSLSLSATNASFADKNAGVAKNVAVTGIALGGTDAGNYNLASSTGSGSGTITPKAVTITGMTAVNKVYDGSTKASVSGGAISGTVGAETLGATGLVATFDDKNAGVGKTVTTTGTTLVNGNNGGLASNYTVTNPTFTANITPKALTVSGMTAGSKVYDGLLAAALSGGTLSGLVSGETLVLTGGTGVFGDKNVGSGKQVTVSGVAIADGSGLASNYTVTSPANLLASITPKALTVAGVTAANKTYDGSTAATLSGGTLDGLVGTETLTLSGQSGVFSDKNAGNGKVVTVSGAIIGDGTGLASNYTVSNATGVTANIAQKELTVSGTAIGKTYDGSAAASLAGAALNGLVDGETLALAAAFADKHAGNGKAVTVSVGDGSGLASNYTLANPTGLTANIDQKALTVTDVTAANKTYDGSRTASLSGGKLNGLVGDEILTLSGQSGVFSDKNAGSNKDVTVSGATLGDAGSGATAGLASNYKVSNATGVTANIAQKELTVSGTAIGKTYDGSAAASLAGAALNGLVDGETLALAAAFADKHAGNGKAVTVSVGDGSGLASNYTLANPTGLTANIDQKALTVTDVTAANKTYDGSRTASLSGGKLNGLVGDEILTLSGQSGVFSDKNAGSNKDVTVSGATLGDAGSGATAGLASNYKVSNATGVKADIAQKAVTVAGITAGNKEYDGKTTASLDTAGATFSGMVADDQLTASASGAFADKNAATGKDVNITGIALGGVDAGNYKLSGTTALAKADISKATITAVAGITAGNKVYDGKTAASLDTSGATFTGMMADDQLTASASGAFVDKNAATGKGVNITGIALGGADAGNYKLSGTTAVAKADIAKATITAVGGIVAGNKVYDGNTAATIDTSGATFGGMVAGDSLTASAGGAFGDKNAAKGKTVNIDGIALGGTDAGNYALASTSASTTADITARALILSGQVAGSKVYDGNANASLSGGVLNGLVAGESLGIAGQSAVFGDKNAANGKTVTVSGTTLVDSATGLASNYTVADPSGLTASITQKALTVTGQVAGNKVYDGNSVASLSGGSLTGLVGSETLGIAGQTAAFSDKNAANGKVVTVTGTTLVDGTGSASNYSVGNPTGLTASITQKALTVTGQVAGNKVYDGNSAASLSGGSLAGLVAGEALGIAGQAAVFADKNVANGKAVTVTGTTLVDTASGAASNYAVSNPTGLTASITPASLLVSATGGVSRVYDTTTNASASLSDNRIGSDQLTITSGGAKFADKNAGINKTVTVSGIALSGADAGNYTVNATATTTGSITQAALGVKVDNAEKDQGLVNPAFTASYAGLLGNDTLANEVSGNLVFSTPAGTGSAAGSYLVSAAGQSSTNYALTYTPGVLTVKPTEVLQSALASVIGTVNVAPSQGNMVQAEKVATGEPVDSKSDAVAVVRGETEPGSTASGGTAPAVQATGAVTTNVLPGLRLSVVDTGLRLPSDGGATSVESQ